MLLFLISITKVRVISPGLCIRGFCQTRSLLKTLGDHYKVLGVKPDATLKEIKAAYIEAVKKHHPDSLTSNSISNADFHGISEAYEILSDVGKRHAYDIQRQRVSPANKFNRRYAQHTRSWNRPSFHQESVYRSKQHEERDDVKPPTTHAEYTTMIYGAVVFGFVLYVLSLYIR